MELQSALQPKGSPSIRRERTGCLTCRRRKKKCDGESPVCVTCKRLNYICIREDPRKPKIRPGRPRVKVTIDTEATIPRRNDGLCRCSTIPSTSSISSFWNSSDTTISDQNIRPLSMRYYIQVFTSLITTTLENNCFLSVFLPMSMESPVVLDAITAWSSSHLALREKSHQPAAIASKVTALKSLSESFSSSDRVQQSQLASCLIHCAMESITGDTRKWYCHLTGAYEVIKSMCTVESEGSMKLDLSKLSSSFEGRWLLRSFAYHDIMMTIAEDRKPLLVAGEYWNFDEDATSFADTYFGLASKVLLLISEISILNVDMMSTSGDVHRNELFGAKAQTIQSALINWTCAGNENGMLVNLAEMYRSAALIHLYRTIRVHRPSLANTLTGKIKAQVFEITTRLENMPPQCLAESSLLLPLFMAGGEAQEEAHICLIRQRMQDIIDSRHFLNFQAVLNVLEEVWASGVPYRTASPATTRKDWKEVIKKRQWMLSIT